jgi:signal transduction histidine kinase
VTYGIRGYLPGLAWATTLAVVLGALVGATTVLFIYQVVFGYYVLSSEATESVQRARALGNGAIPVAFFTLSVLTSGFAAGYAGNRGAWLLGLLCGVVAATTEQTIVAMNYPPVATLELSVYLLTGTCFGIVGGWLGGREAERTAAGESALYCAMREVGNAQAPEAVARAIGSLFVGAEPAGVALWLNSPVGKEIGEAAAVWQGDTRGHFSPRRLLQVANDAAPLGTGGFRSIRAVKLRRSARDEWERQGVKSALVSPLISSNGDSLGLLFVGFAEAQRASRLSATWRTKRRLLTAAAGAAMALKQEETGRMLGMLQERQRVSKEIHDTILQYLITVSGELETAELAARSGGTDLISKHFTRAQEGIRRGSEEARRLMREMRPEILDGSSLPEAIATLTRRITEESEIEATCEVRGEVNPLPVRTEHALARITEEALSNVRKHSGASQARTSLQFRPRGITLIVSDDGSGPGDLSGNAQKEGIGFGIRSMMERAEDIGGRLQIESPDGDGTRVVVDVVVDEDEV